MYENLDPIRKYIGSIDYDENFYAVLVAVIAVILTIGKNCRSVYLFKKISLKIFAHKSFSS